LYHQPVAFFRAFQQFGWKKNAKLPGQLSAYSRIKTGWLDPIVITRNGYYAIQPASISGVVYKINAGFPEGM